MSSIYLAGQGLLHSTATLDYPRPERLVQGNPERTTYSLYEHPNMSCGIWHCEVGAWQIEFADNKQEFFQVIAGHVRLHDRTTGHTVDIQTGQAGIIPPGFKGTFEVLEQVQKYYVIVEV